MFRRLVLTLLLSAWLVESSILAGFNGAPEQASRLVARKNRQSCLKSNLIQSASDLTGQEPGTEGIKDGQSASAIDANNFINFCEGQQITNGVQIRSGSCNGIPMGRIPAASNMISAMITNPKPGDALTASTTFNIQVQTSHLRAGTFVNPTTNYYTAPQDLDGNGDIIGHCHVTIQDIGSLQSTSPPDPSRFAFFKGIDDDGNGQGLLQAVVDGGLPAGVYRVCTMIAAANHQPVTMPVAQRGAQDDCTKFEVVANQNGGGDNQNASNNQGGADNQNGPGNQNGTNNSIPNNQTNQGVNGGQGRGSKGRGSKGRGRGFRPGQRGQRGPFRRL